MSINKVRVYELTRELNLETKDILSICEQTGIAVKTASSTISEEDAERIRAVASEKKLFIPNSSTVKVKESAEADKISKQQIVTVSKPTVNLSSPPTVTSVAPVVPSADLKKADGKAVTKPKSTQPEILVSSVAKPQAPVVSRPEPVKPALLGSPNVTKPEIKAEPPESNSPEPKIEVNSIPEMPDLRLETKPEIKPEAKPARALANTVSPIATPRAAKPSVAGAKMAEVTKAPAIPVKQLTPPPKPTSSTPLPVKQPKPQQNHQPTPISEPKGEPKVATEKVTESAIAKPRLDKPKPSNRPPESSPPPKRPSQPARPAPVKDSVLIERGITAPSDLPRPMRTPITAPRSPERPDRVLNDRPERPTPPNARKESDLAIAPVAPILAGRGLPSTAKVGKRGKSKKEDEEQDLLEQKEKAKLNRPNKRFLKVIDEDDIIDDLESTELAQVSLSLARPAARPKQRLPKLSTAVADAIISKPGARRGSHRDRRAAQEVVIEKPTKITLQESVTVQELADQMQLPQTDIIRTLFMKGVMVTINQTLDIPTASMVATELGYEVEVVAMDAPARKVTEMIQDTDLENLQRRPPVVTIMGHVDHGKTTLLDSIRKTKVAQGEAGGITQHIGAYHVDVEHNGTKQQIVFLDTPGHEAFTAMRARGARVTDVAILVVAADDGVQPQTIEAISHARAAKVPIIVAINKVDKPEAQPDRIRQELTEYGLVDEEWGGDTIMVPVSALKGQNLDGLLEMILLVTEVEDLQANPDRPARGTVIEAHLDKARGPVATFLIQNGTLRVGDILVAGSSFGKVRAMVDDRSKSVKVASPSFAVEVLGLSDVPAAGDEFEVYLDEKQARAIANDRSMEQRHSRLQQSMASRRVTLGTVSAKAQEGDLKELNLILKADVQGSVEAILGALGQLPQGEVQVRVLLSAAGEITENDVELAAASDAVIIGFNTSMATGARQASDAMGVDVRDYNIIYKLLEDIQDAMEGLLEPEMVEEHLGIAEVRALFAIGRGVVAGCYVQSGKLMRNCRIRVKRRGELLHETALDSLKRMKDDVKEVAAGFECGIALPKFQDWQEGDTIEAFRLITKRRTLNMAS